MPTPRRLLRLGPYSADLRARALDDLGDDPDGLWIVPTPMARDQLGGELARRSSSVHRPRAFAWDDLWIEVARRHRRPPAILSDASARSALVAAIGRARSSGELGLLERVADLPGVRRELRARFASWTLDERHPERPAPRQDAATVAAWHVFRHYRAILIEEYAEDVPGLASWASRALTDETFGRPKSVAILDLVGPSRPRLRALEWAARSAESTLVTLPWTGDPDDPAVGPTWEALAKLEFEDEESEDDDPTPLAALEQTLFDPDADPRPIGPIDGLSILGGPRGDGLGLILAREVSRRIEAGVAPDDIFVLFPRWDDDAARAAEIVRDAGIPASGLGPRSLAADGAVAALVRAESVAVDGWESSAIVRLLRNGALGPSWSTADARAEAASAIQSLRVFRGREAIASALDRAGARERAGDRPGRAGDVFGRLARALDGPAGPAPWSDHADRLRSLADALGLASDALGSLLDALDDHALVRDQAARPLGRAAFVREVEAIAHDLDLPAPSQRPNTVRLATIAESDGVRARVILVANLGEGTFPSRESVAGSPIDEDSGGLPLAYARERLALRRVLGSARDEVVLLVPTSDESGQELLPAGFVDEIRRRLGPVVGHPSHAELPRLDPVFLGHPDLALTPADARIHAVARACLGRDTRPVLDLVRDPSHRRSLEGVARGLRLVHDRSRVPHFNAYDGLLADPRIVARIAADFGPEHAFSPSQIESFALCPFQFYLRYVLRLDAADDRPELRIDHASRGDRLHKILEEVHAAIAAEGAAEADLRDRVADFLRSRLAEDPDGEIDGPGDVASALRALEEIELRRTLGKYGREFRDYQENGGASARPLHFEWAFGLDPDRPDAPPAAGFLDLGDGGGIVRLRGKIDRIDLLDGGFRVIDYKTGHAPSPREVTTHLRAVQLPLYALAVERLLLDGVDARDFGYWTLGREGFRPIELKKETWAEFRGRVEAEVVRLVALLRRGAFTVEPKRDGCRKFCDYRSACRLTQVLNAEKEPVTAIIQKKKENPPQMAQMGTD